MDLVRESVELSLKWSLHRRNQTLGLFTKTCRKVIKENHKNYSYRKQTKQNLTVVDKTKRKTILENMMRMKDNSII